MADVVRDLVVKLGIQFDDKSAARAEAKVEQLKYAAEGMAKAFSNKAGGRFFATSANTNIDPGSYLPTVPESLIDRVNRLRTALTSLAAAYGVYKIASFIQHTADAADELKAQAERIGTTTQALQGLQFAAEQSDTSAQALGVGLQFLARSSFAAANGSKEAQEAFSKLGIRSLKDANGNLKTTDQLMLEVADGLRGIESPAERTALAMRVMGRGAGELAPFLAKGSDEILAFRQELDDLGGTFATDFVDIADEWNDNAPRFAAVLKGIGAALGRGILPSLNKLVGRFFEFWKFSGGIIRSGLEKFLAGVGYALDTIGAILEAFLYPAITFVASLVDWFGNLDGGLQVIIVTLGAVAAAMFGLLAPWVLIAAAIGFVVEDIYTYFIGGDSITGDILKAFEDLGAAIVDTFFGVFDEIKIFTNDWLAHFNGAINAVKSFFGGGDVSQTIMAEGGTAGASASGVSVVSAPTTTTQVTVNAAPGMDEDALVGKMIKRLDEHHDERNRETSAALVPALGR